MKDRSSCETERRGSWRLVGLSLCLVLSSLILFRQTMARTEVGEEEIEVSDEFYQLAPVLCEAYIAIRKKYVEPVEPRVLVEGAIQGMFSRLDPHSAWMPLEDYEQLEKETGGEFSGIGIHIVLDRNGVLTVASPIPGSPAARAGLLPWDRIIEIEGKSTENTTLREAVKKLTGPIGTKVNITVYREGERLNFTITRAQIKIENVYSTTLDDGKIGYARIAKFSKEASNDLHEVLDRFNRDGVKGLIIDLRFNTGGLLKEAIEMADLFLPKDTVVVSTRGRDGSAIDHRTENDAVADQPLIVLVNRASASASEIVAGAIKDHGRGYLLGPKGERTFGKGSVQTIEELRHTLDRDEDGNPRRSAVRITTAKFYTPKGTRIEGGRGDSNQPGGLAFDLEVELPKGYERELYGNLLGEIEIEEPEKKPDKNDAKDDKVPDAPSPDAEDDSSTKTAAPFYVGKEKEEPKKYVDLQLEEAKKYLRLLVMENGRARN